MIFCNLAVPCFKTVADFEGAEPAPPLPFGRRTDAVTVLLIVYDRQANLPNRYSALC